MKGKSILLALSGSQQSRYATEVCWKLATQFQAKITAHHVVDSHSAWEFLGHEKPGYLKSDRYLNAYQALCKSLFCLGEELAEAYASEAKKRGVDDVCIVDEGNPIDQICRRSRDHKLVVIGHRSHSAVEHSINANEDAAVPHAAGQFMRLSIAEALSNECPRPLLIVQDECSVWTSMTILISMDHVNEIFINSCLDMADGLKIKPVLMCISSGEHEESPESFIKDLRESNSRLATIPMAVAPADSRISIHADKWFVPDGVSVDKKQFQNTLVVIPTRKVADERITVVDSSPAFFVRNLTLPSILLCPEEYSYSLSAAEESKAVSKGAAI
jgi:nucleotide-binding universal stress UspA family protein